MRAGLPRVEHLPDTGGSFEKGIELLVVPHITDCIPSKQFDIDTLELDSFNLADVSFNEPGDVDILLGAKIFYELLRSGQIRFPGTDIVFQNTVFGFVATGSVPIENETTVHCGLVIEDLDANLRKFWEIEDVEGDKLQIDESLICEDHFMKTHSRNDDGSYVVKMPFKIDPPCLGESKHIATKRFNSLWQRLKREPEYRQLYSEFLTEYENLGHMQETCETPRYIMPHHGVFRPESRTTKLRVVFNASEATSSGQSLNDNLYSGSVVQDDLFAILLRF
ncbi:uncharacterized protein LOC129969015 [Argiope bruennichi]|uniref:uncharacterized protein LOC129969015 n=1 Tax=Argiope bruennichi TaxID=94029 RepID=UPI002493E2A7|nr:uncharacterized protein LOC129969015 [Argiope bruennichi]